MDPKLSEILMRAQTLYEDVDFKAVAAWKSAAPGRKAVGYMPTYVPREVIWAGGVLPVGVLGAGDRLEIIRGDAFFQSYICHIPRSTVELALSGRLEVLDGMLFPSICDVIRNLSGMWTMLFPGRYTRYVDLPQNYDSRVGGEFWRGELAAIREDMARLAGGEILDEALRSAIRTYNENRRALCELYRRRGETPWLFPISQVYVILRAGAVLPPDEHTALVRQYLDLATQQSGLPEDRSRVVLAGMFCEQPPLGLLVTLERAGCWIVDDDLLLGLRWFTSDIPGDGDPIGNLAQAYLTQSVLTASRYAPEGHRGQWLVDSVRRHRADGVIFCAPSFCDPALLEQPMLAAALERERIPYTQFKYSEDTGQFAVIREQAGTFSDSIRLWSRA
jgi:benzoyl-CoA reductase subunit C